MGVSWIVEAVPSAGYSSAARWVFTDFINFMTGIYIFTHFICTPSIRNLIEERFPIFKRNKQNPPSSTASQGDVIRASTSGDVPSTSSIELRTTPWIMSWEFEFDIWNRNDVIILRAHLKSFDPAFYCYGTFTYFNFYLQEWIWIENDLYTKKIYCLNACR